MRMGRRAVNRFTPRCLHHPIPRENTRFDLRAASILHLAPMFSCLPTNTAPRDGTLIRL